MFRRLKENEIEVRLQKESEYGAMLLLYKDARCDMNILDETVGPFNWQREHTVIGDTMYCGVSVKDPEGSWVIKWDAGSEGNYEKGKSQASDSFKRACFNWGIGRELYTSPLVWIRKENFVKNEKYVVEKIAYDSKGIKGLSIADSKGKRVFVWVKTEDKNDSNKQEKSSKPTAKSA